ncbi:MFS antiporter Qdrp1 [[Candida] anglica]|uniref:MFS antiporter Qdrp1 n=1 Tax=[Candida] anglica TaxID=148631 RepID=A0ABP0EP56_9ASCO
MVSSSSLVNCEELKHKEQPPYSILTKREKGYLAVLISLTGIWSTLSSSIYFPALPILSEKFKEPASITNVSVVVYLIFQGLGPSFMAPIADKYGRRPSVLFCLVAYCATCIGLSRTNVYWLLVVLRCIQALSIAPVISISSGVVGDICPRSERGVFVGIVTGLQLVGQGFGGLLGAGLVSGFGWRGIFVFLAIGSGVVFILALILYPETSRSLVGDMSVQPKRLVNLSPILYLPTIRSRLVGNVDSITPSTNSKLSNAFAPFVIFFKPTIFFILLPGGLQFTTWTMSLTTLSTSLSSKYDFSVIKIGLCYLAPGLGSLIGSLASGKLLNLIYKQKKDQYDEEIKGVENPPIFNIYKARLHICIIPSLIAIACYIVFGWCIQYRVNIAVPLIAAFIYSTCAICIMSALTTLLVDLFPHQGSSSSSCINLMRCLLGAAGVGVLQSIVDGIGEGGCYTIMGGFCAIGTLVLWFVVHQTGKKLIK